LKVKGLLIVKNKFNKNEFLHFTLIKTLFYLVVNNCERKSEIQS